MQETKPYFDWSDYNHDVICTNTTKALRTPNTAREKEYNYKRKAKRQKERIYDSKNNLDN